MNAKDWLEAAIAKAQLIGDDARYPELVGAIEALAASHAIAADVAKEARQRLDETFVPSVLRGSRSGRQDEPAIRDRAERLYATLCPGTSLGRVDGMDIVLVAVELWTSTVIVRIAAIGSSGPLGHESAGVGTVTTRWSTPSDLSEIDATPRWPGAPWTLLRHPPRLSDDVGTPYQVSGGQSGGQPPWRAEHSFIPAPPGSARVLTVSLPRRDGLDVRGVDVRLPMDWR